MMLYNLWVAITLPACRTHYVATGCAGIGAACTDTCVRLGCQSTRIAGLILGWAGGMLHRTHMMHHGLDCATLLGPAFGAMLGELCVVVIVSGMEVECNCFSVV